MFNVVLDCLCFFLFLLIVCFCRRCYCFVVIFFYFPFSSSVSRSQLLFSSISSSQFCFSTAHGASAVHLSVKYVCTAVSDAVISVLKDDGRYDDVTCSRVRDVLLAPHKHKDRTARKSKQSGLAIYYSRCGSKAFSGLCVRVCV